MPDVSTKIKDAAYVTVGLGVLGFQKAQVRRVELTKVLTDATTKLGEKASKVGETVGDSTNAGMSTLTSLTQTLEGPIAESAKFLRTLAEDLDARAVPVRARVEGSFDAVEERLPEATRKVVAQARAAAKETEGQVRARLGLPRTAA